MLFTLEALDAGHGDALLLHYGTLSNPKLLIIDGGVSHTWEDSLHPRLEEIQDLLGLTGPVVAQLCMVSHIDGDHISGVIDMLEDHEDRLDNGDDTLVDVRGLWHNSFDDIVGNNQLASVTSLGALVAGGGGASFGVVDHSLALTSSVPQGQDLRDVAARVGLQVNQPVGRIEAGQTVDLGNSFSLEVLGPSHQQLVDLQADWDSKISSMTGASAAARARLADFVDKSVANLSSIVVLAKKGTKEMLLTGDARGDFIITSLRNANKLNSRGRITLDLLKVPHHGSDANVSTDFFRTVKAHNYVFSGDGTLGGNPDISTLTMLTEARGASSYTMYFTQFLQKIDDFVEQDHAANTRNYDVVYREDDYFSTWVDLGDALDF